MTLEKMIEQTAELLDKSVESSDYLNVAEVTAFKNALKNALNNAYLAVARDKWRPCCKETMTVVNGRIAVCDLSECFVSLKQVELADGTRIDAKEGKDYIHVPMKSGDVEIVYYYLPAPMESDNDEPVIPESVVSAQAYIFYAASMYCSIKRLSAEAAVWDARYRNAVNNIRENRGRIIMPARRWR